MAAITASLVKSLRDATNVSMMECKRALVEAEGDLDSATKLLRERGMAVAAKKASRAANQGLVASATSADGKICSLIEVNCETDFVARNDTFINFVASIADKACGTDDALAEQIKEEVTAKVVEIGENIVLRRNTRVVMDGTGSVASYIHMGGKVGVLVKVACEKAETVENETFQQLVRDLCLHVAATSPQHLTSDEIPAETLQAEREIFAKQVEGKPAEIVDKIVEGKIRKFCEEICLVNQGFVKEPKQSITDLCAEVGKAATDTVTIQQFVRYQLGA